MTRACWKSCGGWRRNTRTRLVKKDRQTLYGAQTLRVGAGAVQRRAPKGRQRTGQGCRVQTARPESGRQVSMGESVFEVVKQSLTVREAAELYGIAVGRAAWPAAPSTMTAHPPA